MIQTFQLERGRFRYEVAVFGDGSVAARRYGEISIDNWTDTFDGVSSAEEELGIKIPLGKRPGYEPTEETDEP